MRDVIAADLPFLKMVEDDNFMGGCMCRDNCMGLIRELSVASYSN